MIADYFKLAIGNLRKRKLRSWLTIIGIFISVATIFLLISLSIGLDNAVKEQFRLLGTDKIFIMPRGQAGPPGAGGAVELTTKDVEVIERVAGVKDVSYYVAGNAKIEFNGETRYLIVIGIPLDKSEVYIETGAYKAEQGRLLKEGDNNRIMIGNRYITGMFKKPVSKDSSITINDREFKVIGILETIGNSQDDSLIYLPLEDFKKLFNVGERVDQVLARVKPGEDVNIVSKKINKKLMSFRDVTEKNRDFLILTPEELLQSFGTVLNIITAFLVGVAGISLLVGTIGIANTMYTSVLERTKEIGVMKAIGARNSDILLIFVIESGLLGLIGGLIGVGIGIGLAKAIDFIAINYLGTNLLNAATPLYLILGCLAFAFLIGAVSGILPAMQASKVRPADSLRYE